ncbi:hypothetical protein O181_012904 [Austropuccinia psidii MF-1]|uniref:Uncharacterized protein n=1 Tax=Austropuccinia psidii MF-1 TaxID=1389203 RepID=A0A9Q3BVF4_9BASI|nr:hypothetical protein [Austropuccinia psidii MF-1]
MFSSKGPSKESTSEPNAIRSHLPKSKSQHKSSFFHPSNDDRQRTQHESSKKRSHRRQNEEFYSKTETRETQGEKLYRLDPDSELWRTADGSKIYWEVHLLTFKELSGALWNWSERGLDQTQKLYTANLHPPHSGHRLGVLDLFSNHRQKLVRDHLQRIYSDLYHILINWHQLIDYLCVLDAKGRPHDASKSLKKMENRLTFHFMIAIREYGGLPLDPKHPDCASWPGKQSASLRSDKLVLDALVAVSKATDGEGGNSETGSSFRGSPSQVLCSHCHEVLEVNPIRATTETAVQPFLSQTAMKVCVEPQTSTKAIKKKKPGPKPNKSAKEGPTLKNSEHVHSQATRCKKKSSNNHSKTPSLDSGSSLISFDSLQFSNTFGKVFHLL